jgi:dTDP-4-dehydrorhamnose reductase|tara:strand:+ start:2798 stop:3682 length:885 start_codon:yes stop_codon:yes gene_type:complete
MKICIIGGSGVIGSKFVKKFSENYNVHHTYFQNKIKTLKKGDKLDITNKKSTIDYIKKLKPNIVIHCAALANVDLCEEDKKLADKINVEGCKNIVESCKMTDSKLIFISTSFVFDGKKKEYFEKDKTSPSTYYGYTKVKGEEIIKKSGLSYLILRIDQPYCWIEDNQRMNSVLRVIETLKRKEILYEIEDWYNTPTYVPDLVFATLKLIKNNSNGIFHVVGSDFINRYDWSMYVAKKFKLDQTKIKSINSKKLDLTVKRPNINLKNLKISKEIKFKMNGIKEGVTLMKKEISNS